LNKAYIQHILPFKQDDFVETTINILTDKGLLDFLSFKWLNMTNYPKPKMNHFEFSNEHNKQREVIDFDLSRFCELEIMKNRWNDISKLDKHTAIVNNLRQMFEPHFQVQKLLYDDIGYYIFKVYLIAKKKGICLLT
jgi:hypothetical protein